MPDTPPTRSDGERPLFENDDGGHGMSPSLGGDLGEAPLPPAYGAAHESHDAHGDSGPLKDDVITPDGVAPTYDAPPSPGVEQPDRAPVDGDFHARPPVSDPAADITPAPDNEQDGELRAQARAQSRTRAPAADTLAVETDAAETAPDDNDAL